MSRAKDFNKRMDEVNPFKLARQPVRKMTISSTADKLDRLKNALDVMLTEFILEEDDPKIVAGIKDSKRHLNMAIASLRKVEK